ncbi:MAG: hypothetical protein RL149_693 [Actinomycetota bacterium]
MFIRSIAALAIAAVASLSLTACDPPMPPEVVAALAEQSYTCEQGDTQISAPADIAAVAADWQGSVAVNCVGMSISPATSASSQVELQIGDPADASCIAYVTVPFAVDAVVFAVNLDGVSNLNLNALVLEKILAGEINNWNDPQVVKLNPGFELPDLAISYGSQLSAEAAKPLTDWLTRLAGHEVEFAAGNPTQDSLTPGSLIMTTFSQASTLGLTMAGIVAGKNLEKDTVVPEMGSISTGATQFKIKKTGGELELTFDSTLNPIAPIGIDVAPNPYQAISIINLRLCGTDSLKTRAAARYILRQDSQGSLGMTTLIALPEVLRIESLAAVSVGLPMPDITPEAN